MPEMIVVQVDPPRLTVGAGEQATAEIIVQNHSEDVVYYRLRVDGAPANWLEIIPEQVSAFPLQQARAKLRLHPPADAKSGTSYLSVRAAIPSGTGEGATLLEVEVAGIAPAVPVAPPPVVTPQRRTASQIEVGVTPVTDATLPPTTGKWQLRVRNTGTVIDTFGFNVAGIRPVAVTVDPPQVPLVPGQEDIATLTLRLPEGTAAGVYPFVLRAFSHLNPQARTETPIRLEVAANGDLEGPSVPPAGATDGPDAVAVQARSNGPVPLGLAADRGWIVTTPSAPARVNLVLQNGGGAALALDLSCLGVPDGWISVGAATVNAPPHGTVPVGAAVSIPGEAPTGFYPIQVRAQAHQHPGLSVQLNLLVEAPEAERKGRGPAPIQLAISEPRASTAPGAEAEVAVTIKNLTTALDTVGLAVEGIDAAWVEVVPSQQIIYPQTQATARLVIRPPVEGAVAGLYPLRVKGRSQEYAGQEGETTAELEVQLVGDYQAGLKVPAAQGIREASYAIQVQNQANAPLQLQFRGSDAGKVLAYKFDPPELTVAPGAAGAISLTVQAQSAADDDRVVSFRITTLGQFVPSGGEKIAATSYDLSGQFHQTTPPRLTLVVDPPRFDGLDSGQFELRVGNPADVPMKVRVAAEEARDVAFDFVATELTVPPHGQETTQVVVRATTRPSAGQKRESTFRVTATAPDGDARPASAEAVLVTTGTGQPRRISRRLVLALPAIGLAAAGIAVAAGQVSRSIRLVTSLPEPSLPRAPQVALPRPTLAPPSPTALPPSPTAAPPPTAIVATTPGPNALQGQVMNVLNGLPPKAAAVFQNLNGPEQAQLNPTDEVPSASTIKLAIMIEVYRQVNEGRLSLSQQLTVAKDKVVGGTGILQNQVGRTLTLVQLMEVTLSYSDNTGGNMLIDLVGMDQVNQTMKKLGFIHTHLERRLMDTQAEQQGRENLVSAGDLAEMLRQIYQGKLIGSSASADMLRILTLRGQQTDPSLDFIGRTLNPRPSIAHLNGILTGVRDDAGIVEPPGAAYILVILLTSQSNETAAENAIAQASATIFTAMTKK